MRVKNRLLNFGKNVIYQDDDYFAFSIDSVLLANFVTIKYRDKKILDLCCGNAPIPMLLTFRTSAMIYGLELQSEVYKLGVDSVIENHMDKQINLICGDVLDSDNIFEAESFDVITCNPPYFKFVDSSYVNNNYIKSIARHELKLSLEDVLKKSCYLLKNHGVFSMVHRPDRFMEIIKLFEKYRIEPKKIRFVYSKNSTCANILLIEGIKNGNSGGLKIMPPLFVYNDYGNYSDEVKKMFGDDYDVANKL